MARLFHATEETKPLSTVTMNSDRPLFYELPGPRISSSDAHPLLCLIRDRLLEGRRRFVIDLRQVEYLDSTLLSLLILLKQRIEGESGTLELCGMSHNLESSIRLTGFDRHFRFTPEAAQTH